MDNGSAVVTDLDIFVDPDRLGTPSQTGERDENGIRWTRHKPPRPYIYDPEAGKETVWSRCTSWIDCLDDRSVLEKWKQRIVLVGLSVDPGLIEQVLKVSPDDKDALSQITDAAFERGDGWVRTHKGTDLHRLCEQYDTTGQLEPCSNADLQDVLAYNRALIRFGLKVIDTERRVVVDNLKVTGTFDRILLAIKDIYSRSGKLLLPKGWQGISDIKTGRVDWGMSKMAMQLAVYAKGKFYDGHTQQRTPMEGIDQHTGLIIHLLQGEATCTVYKVDLDAGWEGVLLAQQVRSWRNRKIPFEALP